jgi:hypothetical protein
MDYKYEQIRSSIYKKEYQWFDKGEYNLNIVGIRNATTKNVITDFFDDTLVLCYIENNRNCIKQWPITTDPGLKGSIHYKNPKGVARLVEGQYRSAYKVGLHKGAYRALVQHKPVSVWRDADKDFQHDEVKIDTGLFGINIHKAGNNSKVVSNWSEGCQVFKRSQDFDEFMAICIKASAIYGDRFTYTLISSKDILSPVPF